VERPHHLLVCALGRRVREHEIERSLNTYDNWFIAAIWLSACSSVTPSICTVVAIRRGRSQVDLAGAGDGAEDVLEADVGEAEVGGSRDRGSASARRRTACVAHRRNRRFRPRRLMRSRIVRSSLRLAVATGWSGHFARLPTAERRLS
jgi:hypothetical protein